MYLEKRLPPPPRPRRPDDEENTVVSPKRVITTASDESLQRLATLENEGLRAENQKLCAHIDKLKAKISNLERQRGRDNETRLSRLRDENLRLNREIDGRNNLLRDLMYSMQTALGDYMTKIDQMRVGMTSDIRKASQGESVPIFIESVDGQSHRFQGGDYL